MVRRVTRRTAIRASAVIAAASAVHFEASPSAAAENAGVGILNGVIRKIMLPRNIVIVTHSGHRGVHFRSDATFNRNGPAELADFREGDRVVVELQNEPDSAIGRRLDIRYGRLEGKVVAVGSDDVTTTAGRVTVDADTIVHDLLDFRRQMPTSKLRVGTDVIITMQFELSSSTYRARRIGVPSAELPHG